MTWFTQGDYFGFVKARIVPVEESADICIPRPLLELSELNGDVEVEAQKGSLVIRAAKSPRQGWEAAFSRMTDMGDDQLILNETAPLTRWDQKEWEW